MKEMRFSLRPWSKLFAVAVLLFSSAASAADAPAKAALESAIGSIRRTLEGNEGAAEKQKVLRALTQQYVDFTHFAERALDGEWVKLNAKQRKEFVNLLSELVESSYINRLSEAHDVDIKLGASQRVDDRDEVLATAKVKGSDVQLKFLMITAKNGAYKIDDVEVDDVSLVRNYRSQFGKIISKSSYSELTAKLQKKVRELKTEAVTPTRTRGG